MPIEHGQSRRSIRIPAFDYAQPGAYFITICAYRRRRIFGKIEDETVCLSWIGKIVREEWWRTEIIRETVILDQFVVMPNHFHAIFHITNYKSNDLPVGAHCNAPLHRQPRSVGSLIALFKGSVTRRVRKDMQNPSFTIWQRNYYERVIRDEFELNKFRAYITSNPIRWELERYYPHG